MPSGVASPACSAIVQQFLRGRSASNPSRNPRTPPRISTRPNRRAIRSASSSTPADQPADPTLARAITAGPSDVLTPDDGHAVAALVSPTRLSDLRLGYCLKSVSSAEVVVKGLPLRVAGHPEERGPPGTEGGKGLFDRGPVEGVALSPVHGAAPAYCGGLQPVEGLQTAAEVLQHRDLDAAG